MYYTLTNSVRFVCLCIMMINRNMLRGGARPEAAPGQREVQGVEGL